jgi:hypothetical protein
MATHARPFGSRAAWPGGRSARPALAGRSGHRLVADAIAFLEAALRDENDRRSGALSAQRGARFAVGGLPIV